MSTPIESLVACGTKLWLDSIDPVLVATNRQWGATGATSNPIIVSGLLNDKEGRFDKDIAAFMAQGLDDEAVAWAMTDLLVKNAQAAFADIWTKTKGNDGYVSFELDPLLEDASCTLSVADKAKKYIELGKKWAAGHTNRMIKVPATPGGLAALEELCAAGISLNVTLIFSQRQYHAAREAVWRGAQRRASLDQFKSVYSIFVSRIDEYTKKACPGLSPAAQGVVGLVNVKRLWAENSTWWNDKKLPLQQEIIFASTGNKVPGGAADRYVEQLAGSDIQTNPPATNDGVQKQGKSYSKLVDQMPPLEVLAEIDRTVDFIKMEETLMAEGLQKFADPHKGLLALIGEKRKRLASA
jgi:transaldolase